MAPSRTFQNHYEILRVGRKATSSDIKKAYHELSLLVHPDKHPIYQSEYWNTIQTQINVARDLLIDHQQRAAYDRLWARELKTYFASGWESKPPRAYDPPKPPHVIEAEKNIAKIDHLLYRFRKHVAAIKASNRQVAENHAKLQKIIKRSEARRSAGDQFLADYFREKLATPTYRDRLREVCGLEKLAQFDGEARKAGFTVP
ncbi:MAG: hypothetical protein LQ343_007666 [Gyalolechia ehrenbergii]|nr:MAG: hypothetical protein LQ343_007666 [Gyalolechia ehrenbergii]